MSPGLKQALKSYWWVALAVLVVSYVVAMYRPGPRTDITEEPPGSRVRTLSGAAKQFERDFPFAVIVPPTGGARLGKLVDQNLGGGRVTLRPAICFRVNAPKPDGNMENLEIDYANDDDLEAEFGGPVNKAPTKLQAQGAKGSSVKVRLQHVTVQSGLGTANQIACNFKDGEEVEVVTSQVIAGSVELVSTENSSAKAKAAVARVAKTGAGWKSVDTTTVRGTGIVLFAGLTRLKVQLTQARHDLGADPKNAGSIVLGTDATRVSIRDFNTGQGVLTILVRNDGGEAPTPGEGDCALGQPAVLRRSEPCLFPLGSNASVLLWWEIEKAPYRKVVLHEKLLRTTVSPPLKCPLPFGRPSGGPTPGCECGTQRVAVAPWTSDAAAVRSDAGGLVAGDAGRPSGHRLRGEADLPWAVDTAQPRMDRVGRRQLGTAR